jgi:hypothetical protein
VSLHPDKLYEQEGARGDDAKSGGCSAAFRS